MTPFLYLVKYLSKNVSGNLVCTTIGRLAQAVVTVNKNNKVFQQNLLPACFRIWKDAAMYIPKYTSLLVI